MNEIQRRARNALLGLAVGDAIGWPSMFHRSRLLPPWPRRLRREMETASESTGVLRIPMPFSLNQPADVFDLSPTDDTEWAAWTMERLLADGRDPLQAWMTLVQGQEKILGWVSTQAALENLRRGILPPASGHDNPHFFDDGAFCRAIPIGILFSGDPEVAARVTEADASVTNFEDGIWTAQAIAVAMSTACAGEPAPGVVQAAIAVLPPDSWARRTVDEALSLCFRDRPFFASIPGLHGILNKEYSYGSVGPETLALTLAIVSGFGGDFSNAVMAAASFAKAADSLPAIVGALSGALSAVDPIAPEWMQSIDCLKGISIPSLKGKKYPELVERFVAARAPDMDNRTVRL